MAESELGSKSIEVEHRQASSGNYKSQWRWVTEMEVLPRRTGLLKPGKCSGTVHSSVTCPTSWLLNPQAAVRCKIHRNHHWIGKNQDLAVMVFVLSCWYNESSLLKPWSKSFYSFEFISDIVSTNLPSGRQWHHSWRMGSSVVLYVLFYAHV